MQISDKTCGINVLELLKLRGADIKAVYTDGNIWTVEGTLGTGEFSLPLRDHDVHNFLGKLVASNKEKARKESKSKSKINKIEKTANPSVKIADTRGVSKVAATSNDTLTVPCGDLKDSSGGPSLVSGRKGASRNTEFTPPSKILENTKRKRMDAVGMALFKKFKATQPLEKKRRTSEEKLAVEIAQSYLKDDQTMVVLDWMKSWN